MHIKKINKKVLNVPFIALITLSLFIVIIKLYRDAEMFGLNGQQTKKDAPSSDSTSRPNTVNYEPPKQEDMIISPEKNNTPKPDSPMIDSAAAISVLITRASRSSVGVLIEKINNGKCILTVNQSGLEKVSVESVVVQERDYSTCQGFDLDSSKFASTPITIKVTVSSNGRTGVATQEVN